MQRPPTLIPVIAGFGVMLLLLASVMAIGLNYVSSLSRELMAIVAERNEKAELATRMRALHEARYQSLVLASSLEDPFARDEEMQNFAALAREFVHTREQFLALPVDDEELRRWTHIRGLIQRMEQEAAVFLELLAQERLAAARHHMRANFRPLQEETMQDWRGMVELQRARNSTALVEARKVSERARALTLGLSAAAFIVGALIAVYVIQTARRLQRDLYAEKELAQVTLTAMGDGVLRFDIDGRVRYMNPVMQRMVSDPNGTLPGQAAESDLGKPLEEIFHIYDRESGHALSPEVVSETLAGWAYTLPPGAALHTRFGRDYDVGGSGSTIHDAQGQAIGGVLVLRDISAARVLERKLQWQADHDALTGLLNRRAFEDRIQNILPGKRISDFPVTLMFIDLDYFKQVNDKAGHAAGDTLLRQVADLLQANIRDTDLLARMGGDEFVIMLSACPKPKARQIAENIRTQISAYALNWDGQTFHVGASIGVLHVAHGKGYLLETCMAAADAACYEAKHAGRNQIVTRELD